MSEMRFLKGSVHPLDLPIGPWVVDFGQAVLNAMLITDPVKYVMSGIFVLLTVGELHPIVGQDRVDAIGQSVDEVAQKLSRDHL